MKTQDYEYIQSTLTELSFFIRQLKVQEEKEEFRKKFYVAYDSTKPSLIEDSQLNKKLGIEQQFNSKEIKTMPTLKDLSYRFKENSLVHEFRYRRNGITKSFSSKNLETAKKLAREFCKELNKKEMMLFATTKKTVDFNTYAENYLENVKKVNVAPKTFYNEQNRYKNHIKPYFKKVNVKKLDSAFLQTFFNSIIEKGYQRTAESCFFIIKNVLDYAVENDVITKNPINAVKIPKHNRTSAKALNIKEEKEFLIKIQNHKWKLNFIIMLYTGARPCEITSLSFENEDFIKLQNRKRKNGAIEYKIIPITPKLKPYVEEIKSKLPIKTTSELTKLFKTFCPEYNLYSLRHTFATRCQECEVPQEVVSKWMGHVSQKITDVYTHYSKEFMLKMAEKVDY